MMDHHGPGCGHHGPLGDASAGERLRGMVARLGAALSRGDAEAALVAATDAERLARPLSRDPGPRTRAQARGLLLAVELTRRGDLSEAAGLVEGELRRSFPTADPTPADGSGAGEAGTGG
jgi:hypothetical protein